MQPPNLNCSLVAVPEKVTVPLFMMFVPVFASAYAITPPQNAAFEEAETLIASK
jgi:hypothetical protein